MSKYKVGDELRVREWDDMADEFGLDDDGDINISNRGLYFTRNMQILCGMDFTVSVVQERSDTCRYFSLERIEEGKQGWWTITEDMLEPRTEEDLYAASDNELNNLLNI